MIGLTSLSLFLFVTVAILSIRLLTSRGSFYMLALGRGRHVLELEITRKSCSATLERYHRPLAHYHPDAPLIRTRGYGWFVDNYRGYDSEDFFGLGFRFRFTECGYEFRPVVFQTTWKAEAPNAFVLAVTGLPTAVVIARHWLRRRRSRSRGFEVTRLVSLRSASRG